MGRIRVGNDWIEEPDPSEEVTVEPKPKKSKSKVKKDGEKQSSKSD